jgi:hypothetical protein
MIEAYPLHWPVDYPRTHFRKDSRFKQTLGETRDFLKREVKNIGGSDLIISTNIPLKQNGDLRADYARYKLQDPGVAVYFKRNGKDVVLCCDTYRAVWENIYAVARTIEALRQINRDGVSDFLNRTFTGFTAIPEYTSAEKDIWLILGLTSKPNTVESVKIAFRNKAKQLHPDLSNGDNEAFQELNNAYQRALKFYQQ